MVLNLDAEPAVGPLPASAESAEQGASGLGDNASSAGQGASVLGVVPLAHEASL